MNEIPEIPQFGISPVFFILQLAFLLCWIVLSVMAFRRVLRETSGSATPLWVLVILFAPIIGAVLTLIALRRSE